MSKQFKKNKDKFYLKKNDVSVEIGDFKQEIFYPQFKTSHWNNECNFSVRLKDDDYIGAKITEINNKIEYKHNNKIVRFYDLDTKDENGGFEFEIELLNKPLSNIIEFSIETKNLEFLYQPPLTQEEINKGAERPEEVIGSYAVYHKTKKFNNYKAGKAFHIYRPFVIDKNSNKVWCSLNIDEEKGLLKIEIPQEFLDNAVYPIIVDPTFGYTTIGASTSAIGAADIYGVVLTAPEAGTVDSVSVWGQDAQGDSIKGLVILNSSLAIVSNGVGNAAALQVTNPPPVSTASTFSTPPSIAASTAYVFGIIASAAVSRLYYDAGAAGEGFTDLTNNYTTPTDPTDGATDSNRYSIFVTYTASGGGGGGTAVKRKIFIID